MDITEPRFNDADISALRDARRDLGADIVYLNSSLPQIAEFPDLRAILQIHHDLSKFEQLKKEFETGNIPSLADTTQKSIDAAIVLHEHIDALKKIRDNLQAHGKEWLPLIRQHINSDSKKDIIQLLHQLGEELKASQNMRKTFLSKPVLAPIGLEIKPSAI